MEKRSRLKVQKVEYPNLNYQVMEKDTNINFTPGYAYEADHIPTKETWYILGIDKKNNRVCVAGYPPTIALLSDCCNFVQREKLTEKELIHRQNNFGNNWL